MPSDDLILNLKQIVGYPTSSVLPADAVVVQRGGLGGPYYNIQASDFVADALASPASSPLSVGVLAPSGASGAQVFTNAIVGSFGQRFWNAYIANGAAVYLQSGLPAAMMQCDPSLGWCWEWAQPGTAGAPVNLATAMAISSTGYLDVADTVLVGRDPQAPMEVATANWVTLNTVTSINGRKGPIVLDVYDVLGAAPIDNPRFRGAGYIPTPPPSSCSDRLATTAFAWGVARLAASSVIKDQPLVYTFNGRSGDVVLTAQDVLDAGGADWLDSPALTGIPTAPTAAPLTSTAQIATTNFVTSAVAAAVGGIVGLYAPVNSPNFSGIPTGPTANVGVSTAQLATTAFVQAAVVASTTGVSSFNTRTGAVTLEGADIAAAGGATLVSPAFSGTPSGPTAALGTTSTQLATCAFVMNEIGGANIGVMSFNGRGGAVTLILTDVTAAGGAPLASPAFSGGPTAPTPASGDNSNHIATTAYVDGAIANSPTGVDSFNGRTGAVVLTANDINAAGALVNPSPSLTGAPTAPTATQGTATTQIATTSFVAQAVAGVGGVASFNTRTGAVTLSPADVNAASAGGPYATQASLTGFPLGRNRLINGDMYVDQRNNHAVIIPTTTPTYIIDKWMLAITQSSRLAVAGNINGAPGLALGLPYGLQASVQSTYTVVASDYFCFQQYIEADNVNDFGWGTTGAQPVTLSFWVSSTVPGTYGGVICNSPAARCYPFTFSVAAGWTKVVITIPGDTAGTWVLQGSGVGVALRLDLGSGSTYRAPAGAWAAGNFIGANGTASLLAGPVNSVITFSNVKLELGSIATPYDHQTPSKNLNDCKRYFQNYNNGIIAGYNVATGILYAHYLFPVQMRAAPSFTLITAGAGNNMGPVTPWALGGLVFGLQAAVTATGNAAISGFAYTLNADF